MNEAEQFGRVYSLIVGGANGDALDLSELHFKFNVKRSDTVTPNIADIRVYNLSDDTASKIKKEFKQVILQAGYEGNKGVIFKGNIKQVIRGRENATNTFVDIIAGDGDRAFNFAVVNTSIAAGSSQRDQINAVMQTMQLKGVGEGYIENLKPTVLPRGKVLYGNARNYLTDVADSSEQAWSIQDERVNFVPVTSYLPGEAVVINSKTGMIGTPSQTNEGLNVKMLLNPLVRVGGRVQLNNADVQDYKINLSQPLSPANIPPPKAADGVYYILVAEHQGDTRGTDWYTTLICLSIAPSSNPLNSVAVG